MGRPIKKKFFGNTNGPQYASRTQGSGVGGEAVSQLNVSNSGTLYSQGALVTVAAPNITGGIRATVSTTINGSGNVDIAITNAGSGYTSAPAISITTATAQTITANAVNTQYTLTNVSSVAGIYVGMRIDGAPGVQATNYVTSVGTTTISLLKTMTATTNTNGFIFSDPGISFASTATISTNLQDAISIVSFVPGGASAISGGDIIKQEGSRRYLVQNAQGTGICNLATGVLSAGQMHIYATDAGGATYYVTKLTSRKATLTNRTSTSSAYYVTGEVAPWTIGAASGSTKPTAIVSINHTN